MGCCQSKCCEKASSLYDKYYPKSSFANPRYLLAATLTGAAAGCLIRREPAWPSQSLSALHLTGFAITLGVPLWVTFIETRCPAKSGQHASSGPCAINNNKQRPFGTAYFSLLSLGACASLTSWLLLHPLNTWNELNAYLGSAFAAQFVSSIVTFTYVTPKCSQYWRELKKLEAEENLDRLSDEEQTDKRNELISTSAAYKALDRKFTFVHTASIIANFLILGTGVYHGIHLAQRLRVF